MQTRFPGRRDVLVVFPVHATKVSREIALKDFRLYIILLDKTGKHMKNIAFEKSSAFFSILRTLPRKQKWGTNGCRWSTHWYLSSALPPRAIDQWKRRRRQQLCSWVSRAALACENIGLKQVTRETDEKHEMNDGKITWMKWKEKTHDCIQAWVKYGISFILSKDFYWQVMILKLVSNAGLLMCVQETLFHTCTSFNFQN